MNTTLSKHLLSTLIFILIKSKWTYFDDFVKGDCLNKDKYRNNFSVKLQHSKLIDI